MKPDSFPQPSPDGEHAATQAPAPVPVPDSVPRLHRTAPLWEPGHPPSIPHPPAASQQAAPSVSVPRAARPLGDVVRMRRVLVALAVVGALIGVAAFIRSRRAG